MQVISHTVAVVTGRLRQKKPNVVGHIPSKKGLAFHSKAALSPLCWAVLGRQIGFLSYSGRTLNLLLKRKFLRKGIDGNKLITRLTYDLINFEPQSRLPG